MLYHGEIMNRVYILGGLRTHIGVRNGIFKRVRPEVLGGQIVKALCEKYEIKGPDALFCGNAVGPGGNIGRLLALEGKLPERTPAMTIDLQCASGLAAIHMGALSIMTGENDVVFAGGTESASLQPRRIYAENDERAHERNPEFTAAQFIPGEFSDDAMLLGAERAGKEAHITREMADESALLSQNRAKQVEEAGLLNSVILPLYGSTRDEAIRKRMSEKLLARAPRVTDFPDGILTAANTCTINDGAAFVILVSERWAKRHGVMPSAEIMSMKMMGSDPLVPPLSADRCVSALLSDRGLFYKDIDAFEYNEAFAVISADFRKNHPDVAERLNRWGGALAYGHPYGASGAEIMIHLMAILSHEDGRYGIASIPAAGGVAESILISHVDESLWKGRSIFRAAAEIPFPVEV